MTQWKITDNPRDRLTEKRMGSAKNGTSSSVLWYHRYTKFALQLLNHRQAPDQMHTFILRYLSKGSLKIWRNILCSQLQSTLQPDGLRYWITVVAWLCGASSIWPKLPKIWKQRQMARKFHGKVLRKSEKCWIYEMRAIQLKILENLEEQSWIEINLPR